MTTANRRTVLPHRRPRGAVSPSIEDPVVAGAANLVGGPVGRRGLPRSRGLVLVTLVGFVLVTCGLAWLQKLPCRDPGNWTNNYQYTRVCYSDIVALYYSEELVGNRDASTGRGDRIKVPYVDHAVEYPVVIGGLMWLAAEGTNIVHPDDPHLALHHDGSTSSVDARPETFFDLTALLLTLGAVVAVLATAATHRRRPWDAALLALAPALVFHAFTNWDLAAAAFAAVGLLAWARRYPWLAGVFFGLGAATKLYPALFVVPLFMLCLRARRLRSWFVLVLSGAVAWGAANVAVMLSHYDAWKTFYVLNRSRPADFDTAWYQIQHRWPSSFVSSYHTLDIAVAVAVGVGVLGICALIWFAPRRPRLPQVLFLALAAFLLLNKVYSPQYVVWLIPLAALARPRWRAFLVWQATEIGLVITRYIFFIALSKSGGGVSYGWFQAAVLVRDAALIYLMVRVVIEILRPDLDVVRADGDDDPAGGVLDEAGDRRGHGADAVGPAPVAVSVPA